MTTACLLTPAGRGAIATIRVRGTNAIAIVESLFRSATDRMISSEPSGKILFGEWQSTESEREELVVCRTDDDEIEIQSHGGPAAIDAIVRSLANAGCEIVPWQDEFDSKDLIRNECRVALASATTQRTAGILLAQLNGSLESAIEETIRLVDDDVASAMASVETLLQRSTVGTHLTTPWRVVIAGPPNVGKSSLINALLGFDRAIVFDQPGTTRDVVASVTAFDGWPVMLSDTAGIRSSDDRLEMAGVEMAREQIARADLLVEVHSADHWTPDVASTDFVKTKSITVVNKCDLVPTQTFTEHVLETIATKSIGIDRLIARITEGLVPNPPEPTDAVPFTIRQVELLTETKHSLAANDAAGAKGSLLSILEDK